MPNDLKRTLLAAALCFFSSFAPAQGYPARTVRLVVPFPPGGPTDVVARMLSQRFTESWGEMAIVENKPGAGGNIGVQAVAKSPPDGYMVLVTTTSIAVNMTLGGHPGYDVARDFIPVVNVASSPNMFVANVAGARSLKELIERSRKEGIAFGSAGTGTTPHLTAEYLFRNLAHLKTTHIPYKGAAPAVNAALGNEVPVVCVAMPTAVAHIKAGRLRGLAVTSRSRVAALPDVPTVEEAGFPRFEDLTWVGVLVPAGTPAAIVARLNSDVNTFLADPASRERLAALGFEPVGGSSAAFSAYLKDEVTKWAHVIKETGARID